MGKHRRKDDKQQKSIKLHHRKPREELEVLVVGGGWYGNLTARELKKRGFKPTLYEKGELASGTSGIFSGRIHTTGLHYPRSPATRDACKIDSKIFKDRFPDKLRKIGKAIHTNIAGLDAHGNISKISDDLWREVCTEDPTAEEFDQESHGFQGLSYPVSIQEDGIVNGERLREKFTADLIKDKIPFFCNHEVLQIAKESDGSYEVTTHHGSKRFGAVVNATGFQALLPRDFQQNPLGVEVRYQPCLGLIYKDLTPGNESFSFIALDGVNPCLMPLDNHEYMMTHAGFTVLGTAMSAKGARDALSRVDDDFVNDEIRRQAEEDFIRYYPNFPTRFKYIGWRGEVLAKPFTDSEYRSGMTFRDSEGVVHLFPSKIAHAVRASEEAVDLIEGITLISEDQKVLSKGGYAYIKDGALDSGLAELQSKPSGCSHNMCTSHAYPHLFKPEITPQSKSFNHTFFAGRRDRCGSYDLGVQVSAMKV